MWINSYLMETLLHEQMTAARDCAARDHLLRTARRDRRARLAALGARLAAWMRRAAGRRVGAVQRAELLGERSG